MKISSGSVSNNFLYRVFPSTRDVGISSERGYEKNVFATTVHEVNKFMDRWFVISQIKILIFD